MSVPTCSVCFATSSGVVEGHLLTTSDGRAQLGSRPEPLTRSIGHGVLWGAGLILALLPAEIVAVAVNGDEPEHALGATILFLPYVLVLVPLLGIVLGLMVLAPLRQLVARSVGSGTVRVVAASLAGLAIGALWWWGQQTPEGVAVHAAPHRPTGVLLVAATAFIVSLRALRPTSVRVHLDVSR